MKKNQLLWMVSLLIPFVIFVSLAFKNPYGDKTTIGNFDPFPDTMHYVVPARNFVLGDGFRLWRTEGETKIQVPPLYSLVLIPGYLVNSDPRTFYYTNLFLGILSLYLLFLISKKLSKSPFITILILLFYAGTYVIYWQPTIAMAENVLLPVLLFSIWLWLQPLSLKNTFFTALFAILCYGSKYVSLPLTLSILGLMVIRIIMTKQKVSYRLSLLIITAVIGMFLMNGSQLIDNATAVFRARQNDQSAQSQVAWLSPKYIQQSLPKYAGAIIGLPIYNLFSTRPILPPAIGLLVLVWCVYAAIKLPKYRQISIFILCLVLSQLTFLSMITMVEGRYAFVFLPLIYTGLAAMLGWLFTTSKRQLIFAIIVAIIFAISSYREWKLQLILNFKATETPWWHVGIINSDTWLSRENTKNPILITGMNPFLWDFYRQSKQYQLLPFSNSQDFINASIWGVEEKPNDWWQYYQDQLKQGRSIYLATVGLAANQWRLFETYQQQFNMILINQDCNDSCRLYKINP